MTTVPQIGDADVFDSIHSDDLWCVDKLILSKKLGHECGPAGIPPAVPGQYVVRPIMNLKSMSVGATIQYLDSDSIPDGYFWCQLFTGPHMSFDYNWGKQTLAVEGFRTDPTRLDRFSRWTKIDLDFKLPEVLQCVADKYPWFNVEVIGDQVIEVHFRYNDDFANHTADEIIPVWTGQDTTPPPNWAWYASPMQARLGFWTKNN
jgi:hypothetical protein